jgi:Peptidase family M48
MTIQTLSRSARAAIVHPAARGAVVMAVVLGATSAAAQSLPDIRSRDLLAMDPPALARFLDERRPAPVAADVRARVIAELPTQGEVHALGDGERRKLSALSPVLHAAQRESVYTITIVDLPYAFVGLHARTVLLITRPALRLLSDDELRAIVAHETAHEYVDAQWGRATAAGQNGRLRDLELVCDLIAVMTLRGIGQEARTLPAGIEQILRFNRLRVGDAGDDPEYPSPLLRRSTVLAFEKRISRLSAGR